MSRGLNRTAVPSPFWSTQWHCIYVVRVDGRWQTSPPTDASTSMRSSHEVAGVKRAQRFRLARRETQAVESGAAILVHVALQVLHGGPPARDRVGRRLARCEQNQ